MNRVIKTETDFIAAIAKLGDDRLVMGDLNFHQFGEIKITPSAFCHPEIMSTTGGGVFDCLVLCEHPTQQISYMRLNGLCIDSLFVERGVILSVSNCLIGELHNVGRAVVNNCSINRVVMRYGSNASVRDTNVTKYECDASSTLSINSGTVHTTALPHTGRILLRGCTVDGTETSRWNRLLQSVCRRKEQISSHVRLIDCQLIKCQQG